MKVYRPIKTNRITQNFGDNKACVSVDASGKSHLSSTATVCPSGTVSLYELSGLKGHNGTDMAVWKGEPVYFPAIAEGATWIAQPLVETMGWGNYVDVHTTTPIEGVGYVKFRFAHLKQSTVLDSEEIKPGHLIGYADSTGNSTGDHLHFMMKGCTQWGETINGDNGYAGAIDFMPYYEDKFILDVLKQPTVPLMPEAYITKLIFMLTELLNYLKPKK